MASPSKEGMKGVVNKLEGEIEWMISPLEEGME